MSLHSCPNQLIVDGHGETYRFHWNGGWRKYLEWKLHNNKYVIFHYIRIGLIILFNRFQVTALFLSLVIPKRKKCEYGTEKDLIYLYFWNLYKFGKSRKKDLHFLENSAEADFYLIYLNASIVKWHLFTFVLVNSFFFKD